MKEDRLSVEIKKIPSLYLDKAELQKGCPEIDMYSMFEFQIPIHAI